MSRLSCRLPLEGAASPLIGDSRRRSTMTTTKNPTGINTFCSSTRAPLSSPLHLFRVHGLETSLEKRGERCSCLQRRRSETQSKSRTRHVALPSRPPASTSAPSSAPAPRATSSFASGDERDLLDEDLLVLSSDDEPSDVDDPTPPINLAKGDDSVVSLGALLAFAAPTAAIWVVGPTLGLIDSAVVGVRSAVELAALGPGTVLCDYASYIFTFLAVAATNMLSLVGRQI